MSEHVLPKKLYFVIFASLIVLTAITTGAAFIDLGPFNTVVALVIAVCKASLVVLFFMHLKYQTGMTRVVILAALLWLAVLIGITMSDVFTRHWTEKGAPWQHSSAILPGEPTGSTVLQLQDRG
ncbi:MAG TPA: cytochrome C oxidase subunit IV family protein [Terriglobia bacterium]|jgi:cytochrome c oxidase subunit 4|nr:cytochrome C oxidase subunit IV family protein [Terriglobia bacterium]